MVRGLDFFTQWLNTVRGGVKLNRISYSIVFNFIEDYSNITLIAEVYKLLLPEVDLFVGPYSSGLTRSAANVTDPAGKFLLSTGATNTSAGRALSPLYLGTRHISKIPQESNASAIQLGLKLYKQYDLDPSSPDYSCRISVLVL
jgi:hypothetical protein